MTRSHRILYAVFGVTVLAGCNDVLDNESAVLGTDAASPADSGTGVVVGGDASPSPGCAAGQKACDGLCASTSDPLAGCAAESCDPCVVPRAVAACAADGTCAVAACNPGFADCDGNPSNGCETDLSQPQHCGACDTSCSGGTPVCAPVAQGFTCASGCPAGAPTLCGMQCVDVATSAAHCGSCVKACTAVSNGVVGCSGGACVFTCNSGFHACGEVCSSNASTSSCGGSCTPCPAGDHATPTCSGGACGSRARAGLPTATATPRTLARPTWRMTR